MLYGELPNFTLPSGESVRAVRLTVPNPPRVAFLGLPTNDQIAARANRQKSIRRPVPGERGKTETQFIPDLKGELALFTAIRVDQGDAFNEYEAVKALGKLLSVEAIESERDGEQMVITLKTLFGEVKHRVNAPSEQAAYEYRSSALKPIELARGEELRYKIEPAVKLYDSIIEKIDGYAPAITPADVPPHHKSAVVIEVLQEMAEMDIQLDPNC